MTAPAAPPLPTVPLADLSVPELLVQYEAIRAELQTRGVDASRVPRCHPTRPLAGVKVAGQPACNHCAALALGVPPRDVAYALAGEPERGEYDSEWKRPTRAPIWGESQ